MFLDVHYLPCEIFPVHNPMSSVSIDVRCASAWFCVCGCERFISDLKQLIMNFNMMDTNFVIDSF